MDFILDKVLNRIETLAPKIIKYGVAFLDDATLGIAPEELVVIGARTGVGKTELLNLIAESAAKKANVAFFSLESHELEMEQRAIFRELYRRILSLPEEEINKITEGNPFTYTRFARGAYNHEALRKIIDGFNQEFEARYKNLKILYRKNPTAQTIENDILSMRGEVDLWILDHLHFLSYDGRDELDAVRTAMKLFYDLAAKQKAPLVIASHLRKDSGPDSFPNISDLHGSSEISKRAVACILIDQINKQSLYARPFETPTIFQLSKFRIDGRVRKYYGVHHFNTITRTYSQNYILFHKDAEGELVIDQSPKPEWAKNALSKEQVERSRTLG